MQLLFGDRFAPFTSAIGFIEAEPATAVEAFLKWQIPIQKKRNVSFEKKIVDDDFEGVLRRLEPLTSVEARRFLFIPTKSQWTAFIDNGRRGTDGAPIAFLSRLMGVRTIRAVAVPDSIVGSKRDAKGRYGATILSIFGPSAKSSFNRVRSISAVNDGGRWEFGVTGVRQSFEEDEKYLVRRIQDRFTQEMLERYLCALGIEAFDEGFYQSKRGAYLVLKVGPTARNLKEYSLNEVQEEFAGSNSGNQ